MIYDFFISYEHNDFELVEELVQIMERKGYICWYAPRNVVGRYAKAIFDGISHSRFFLVLINSRSAVSEEVLNEVEIAHNVSKNEPYANLLPVCTEFIEMNDPKYGELMYFVHRTQFAFIDNKMSYLEMVDKILALHPELLEKKNVKVASSYVVQEIEDTRIKKQNQLLDFFDLNIYKKVFRSYSKPKILDIGCGASDMLFERISAIKDIRFIGIDKSASQIEKSYKKYNSVNKLFVVADVENDEFLIVLRNKMEELKIKKFDVIHMSMLLLHLKSPYDLLLKLRGFLSAKGTLLIRDIDDGINFASPDPNNDFERIYKMCSRDEQSGNRKIGRQLYTYLIQAGYKDIVLEKQGLSTAGMSSIMKKNLFEIYFPFTLDNAKIMHEKYPWDIEIKEDYFWYKENYDKIYQRFMQEDFIFSLGFQVYTAKDSCN